MARPSRPRQYAICNGVPTSSKHLRTGTLLGEGRRVSVDGKELVGPDGALLVNGLTDDIDNSTESLGADGHHNGAASVNDGLASDEALSGVEGNGSHTVATEMLSNLKNESVIETLNLERVGDGRKCALELNIDNGTNDLRDLTSGQVGAEGSYKQKLVNESFMGSNEFSLVMHTNSD